MENVVNVYKNDDLGTRAGLIHQDGGSSKNFRIDKCSNLKKVHT
jgi:hypothetical protein